MNFRTMVHVALQREIAKLERRTGKSREEILREAAMVIQTAHYDEVSRHWGKAATHDEEGK